MNNLLHESKSLTTNLPITESYSLEIQESATKLNRLIQICQKELNQAEYVFNSKPQIIAISKQDIFEQITAISGCAVKIRNLGTCYKTDAIEQISQLWDEQIDTLRQKWFIDAKQQPKKGVGWGEKSNLIKEIPSEVESISHNMFLILQESLINIYKEVAVIDMELIYKLIKAVDQNKLNKKINDLVVRKESSFCNPTEYLPNEIKDFKASTEALINKVWGDILWEEVLQFKNNVASQIVQIITFVLDNRVEQVTQAVEKVMSFYNDFLERQERYQQETPEQRQAEKDWIDRQQEELVRVKMNIEAILNAG